MNALAHAIAHSPANATHATSDIAKIREGTTPHHTTRHLVVAKSQDQGGLSQGAALARFAAKVSTPDGLDGCWIWKASTTRSGYAQFWDGSTMVRAHRWAYRQAVGPIADGLECDHLCGVYRCVNPAHIELVTHAVNIERRESRMTDEARARRGALIGAAATRTNAARRGAST